MDIQVETELGLSGQGRDTVCQETTADPRRDQKDVDWEVKTHFLSQPSTAQPDWSATWWGFMWLLVVWKCPLVKARWQPPLRSFWRKFPASLLLLQPGRSFIRWCIRWQSQLRALCSSVGLTFQTLHFLYFSILVDHQGSWSTILQNWETLWGTDLGVWTRVVRINCLRDQLLVDYRVIFWKLNIQDKGQDLVVIGCPGQCPGSGFPGIISLIKDRNFIIWDCDPLLSVPQTAAQQLNPFPPWLPVSQVMENFLLWILLHHASWRRTEQIFISKLWCLVKICVM